jgi:hypothetical protein
MGTSGRPSDDSAVTFGFLTFSRQSLEEAQQLNGLLMPIATAKPATPKSPANERR